MTSRMGDGIGLSAGVSEGHSRLRVYPTINSANVPSLTAHRDDSSLDDRTERRQGKRRAPSQFDSGNLARPSRQR